MVAKKIKMGVVGLKDLNLCKLRTFNFSAQYLHDWVIQVPPPQRLEGCTDTMPLPTILAHNETCIDKSSEQTRTLVHHNPLIPFWIPAAPLHNARHDNDTLMKRIVSYHYLAVWWLQTMGN